MAMRPYYFLTMMAVSSLTIRAYLSRHSHRLATDPLRIAAFLLRALPPARLVVVPCTACASNTMFGPACWDRLLAAIAVSGLRLVDCGPCGVLVDAVGKIQLAGFITTTRSPTP